MSLSTFNNKEKIPLLEPNVYVGPPSFPVMSLFKEEGFYEQNLFKQPKSFSPSTPESPTELEDFKKDTKDKEEKDQDYKINVGHWTREEHERFLEGYKKYKRQWTKIAKEFVKTRTPVQVTSHAQQYIKD